MTFTIKTPEGIKAIQEFLAKNAYLSGGNAPGAEDADLLAEIEAENFCPNHDCAEFFGWWWTLSPFRAPARDLWKNCGKPSVKKDEKKPCAKTTAPVKKEAVAEDDEDLDLFGDDPDAEAAAEKQKEERAKALAAKAKPADKKAAKSIIVFDIKGYEVDFDWNAYADKVRQIEFDGLTWLDSHQVLDIAFGMKKLRMTCIVFDYVETEDIWEKIKEDEENIQNVDIVSFDKA